MRSTLVVLVLGCILVAGLVSWVALSDERPEDDAPPPRQRSSCQKLQEATIERLTELAQQTFAAQQHALSDHMSCDDAAALYPTVRATVHGWTRRPQCIALLKNKGWTPYGPARMIDPTSTYVAQCVVDESNDQRAVVASLAEAASLPRVTAP